ncbi:MAG: DNA alkylation repair protein [Treponema sp.]|uniref:DNA alkylation repair protein n=1 Tax=Treponema sp. TaxID=166 RepID=UPI0025CCD7C5|nr:DNA alkylation repair protein [Treponema sp.]MBQ9282105.1 DNA alkylation repair protein [Treponema sp.]
MENNESIRQKLFSLQDKKYRDFQAKLIPTVAAEKIIGVRTPELRKFAKELSKSSDCESFLSQLPHEYFDENQLHAFLISEIKEFEACMAHLERFLPFIDNWATSDQLSPKVFKKNKAVLLEKIRLWISSSKTYTVRFGIGMLMQHFLDDDFSPEYAGLVASVKSDEYYVNMMIAWYFATALAKQYEAVLPFITEKRLSPWCHKKTIQKALESYRVSDERKDILRGLKV